MPSSHLLHRTDIRLIPDELTPQRITLKINPFSFYLISFPQKSSTTNTQAVKTLWVHLEKLERGGGGGAPLYMIPYFECLWAAVVIYIH